MTVVALGVPSVSRPVGPAPTDGPLLDTFGRVATDLRVSLTDRCNLRCTYCMPAEGLDWMSGEQLLSVDELTRLLGIAVTRLGVTRVRFTGGEPLLAKRLEEVWVPSEPDPIILPRNSDGLYLLQRVRDEAHRFAITYHRSKRSKRMTASALDSVRGLGEHRRKALVTHFGSLARLKQASVEEITAVPGIGAATARAVLEALGIPAADAGVESGVDSEAPAVVIGNDQSRVSG